MEVAGPEKGQKKVGTQDVTHFMSPVCIFFLFLIFLYNIQARLTLPMARDMRCIVSHVPDIFFFIAYKYAN